MLSPGVRLGPYEILAPLGVGGMGEVFRARDTRLGRQVAVKILPDAVSQDERRVARFETEARALAALSHPNILAIHDFGQSDGLIYAVTELLEGESLRDRMAGEPVPWRKAAEIAASIADALSSAHVAGIVHRDLKPENVFLTSDGRVKVLDFGLAKVVEPVSSTAVTLTSPTPSPVSVDGEVIGTLAYMAPEQLRGLNVDGRSDIFALGCLLYEMLSGRRPFVGATTVDTISAILHAEPSPLESARAEIPPALGLIVSRCLEKRADDRFDTAHDVAFALRSISAAHQPAVTSGEKQRPMRGRRISSAVLAAGAALVILAVAVFLGRLRRPATGAASWGPPRQITSAPGWEAEPALSPDGTLVAYSSNAAGNADIWIVDPEGGEPLRLSDGPAEDRKPAWFPDGRAIVFASNRSGRVSIWKVPRLGGSPSLVVEDGDMPAISPDGTRLAFSRADASGKLRIWVAPLADPTRAERLTGAEGGDWDHTYAAWSPDGALICYADQHDLWLVPASGGRSRPFTRGGKGDNEPTFSPDGTSVFFSSHRAEPQSIWRSSLGGGEPERVTPGSGPTNHPSLSGDGRRLAFSTLVVDFDVVVADRRTGTACRIASSRNDFTPAIVPDGTAVTFVSNRLGKHDLWVETLESGCPGTKPPRKLTDLDVVATPVVSPDGRRVAFFRILKGRRSIWAMPLGGGAPAALIEGAAQNLHPAYAPDGANLAFISDRSGVEHVWIVALREGFPSSEPWRLTDGEVSDLFPAWSADGRRLAFIRGGDAWVIDVRPGATPSRVTAGADPHGIAWEPDGAALLVSGLFGTPVLHLRRVDLASGTTAPVNPQLVLGDRDASGQLSLSRDGRFLATDVAELKGNLWMVMASRDGR